MKHRLIPELSESEKDRFWSRVTRGKRDKCWEWQAGCFASGYGAIKFRDKAYYATRVAYFLATGVQPGELNICHRCDNPSCCNPAHLFLGTTAQNVADRDRKGRQVTPRGEQHGCSRLTWKAVRDIRAFPTPHKYGAKSHLARQYAVTRQAIGAVLRGKTWKN